MGYLRHKVSGAVTDLLLEDSLEYQTLVKMRLTADSTSAAMSANILGTISGSTTYTLKKGGPVWEDVAVEDSGMPDPAGGRVFVVYIGPSVAGTDETVNVVDLSNVGGNLTEVDYVPAAAIVGNDTDNRVITLNQVTVSGTSSPTRGVQALATLTFNVASGGNAGGNVPSALAIGHAGFTAVPPNVLEVVSSHGGSGAADPGGILYGVYART